MSTKIKNWGARAAFAVALFVVAALVASCPVEGSKTGAKPPEGKGFVKLNFNKNIQRSILPADVTMASFGAFELQFAAVGGGTGTTTTYYIENETTALAETLTLDIGEYDLTVIAYLVGGDTSGSSTTAPTGLANPVAAYFEDAIDIDNTYATLNIMLRAIDYTAEDELTTGATGIFQWTISEDFEEVELDTTVVTITGLSAASTINNATSPQTLAPGYYYVDFVFTLSAPDTRSINFRHVLHIYANMTSAFTYTLNDDSFDVIVTTRSFPIVIDYEPIKDRETPVEVTGVTFDADTGFSIEVLEKDYVGGDGTLTVTVGNAIAYDTIDWSCGVLNGTGSPIVLDENVLNTAGMYYLTIIGWTEDADGFRFPNTVVVRIRVIQ